MKKHIEHIEQALGLLLAKAEEKHELDAHRHAKESLKAFQKEMKFLHDVHHSQTIVINRQTEKNEKMKEKLSQKKKGKVK